jgi:hypothetical protein
MTVTGGVGEFYVYSHIAGKANIAVGLAAGVEDYVLGGKDAPAASDPTVQLIGEDTITFEAGKVSGVALEIVDVDGTTANGVDYYEVKAKVTAKGGAAVNKETVEFSLNKSGAFLNKTSVETNIAGEAKVKVYADKPGKYTLKAEAAGEDDTIEIEFFAGEVAGVELDGTPDSLTAKDYAYSFKVKLFDINGNQLKASDYKVGNTNNLEEALTDEFNFEVLSEPTESDIDEDSIEYTNDSDLVKVTIPGSQLDTEGDYKVRFYLDNGKKVDVSFTAKEQGDVTKMTITYKEGSLLLGATSANPTIKFEDAAGVKRDATTTEKSSDISFTLSDTRVGIINQATGAITATTDDKYAGKTVTVTAVDSDKNVVATTDITIGVQPTALKLNNAAGDVNEDLELEISLLDVNGNVVALGTGATYSDPTVDFVVISKPAKALVSVDESSQFVKNLREKGTSKVTVSSNVVGDVTVQAIVKTTYTVAGETPVDYVFTGSAVASFGTPKAEAPGANKVTLFIGQQVAVVDGNASVLDVAPFIKDGRTFVPVRFIAEALGADVKYDAATQTVTATRGDDVVVLTIGSNVMTVNGEAQVTDVAPFIVDGRTVLPFRALAEAFGSEVTWDAATQSVVFEK